MPSTGELSIDRLAPSQPSKRGAAIWMAACFALALALAWPGSGARRPLDAHEVFVARTAVEMERRGDYVVPWFNAHERLEKPPLNYWLTILAERVLSDGESDAPREISARLPSILLGAATVALTVWLGWIVFDSLLIGSLGAILFATSAAFISWSRSAQPEMSYTFACTLFVLAVAAARKAAERGEGTWRASACAWSAVALAVLAKGPIMPVLLLAGAAIALRERAGGPGFFRTLHVPAGLAFASAVIAPYFALVIRRAPGAVEFWRSQMFDRVGGIGQAWWQPLELYYVFQALELWLPWSALLLLVPYYYWRERRDLGRRSSSGARAALRAAGLLVWCAVLPCVVLSFSAGRKGYYLLPILPIVGLLMAWASVGSFARAREHAAGARGVLRGLRAHAVAFALVAVVLLLRAILRSPWLEIDRLSLVLSCALLAAAFGMSVWSGHLAARAPVRSAAILLGCAALEACVAGGAGINSNISRYAHGNFARAVASAETENHPLLMLDGDSELLLYYAEKTVTPLKRQELARALAQEPEAWIIDRESELAALRLPGRVVLRESLPPGDDATVLFDPDPDARPLEARAGAGSKH